MFENKLVSIPKLGRDVMVHRSRIIASWRRIGGTITNVRWRETPFAKFLMSLDVNEDDIHDIIIFATNGKLELQTLGRAFLKEQNGETSE